MELRMTGIWNLIREGDQEPQEENSKAVMEEDGSMTFSLLAED